MNDGGGPPAGGYGAANPYQAPGAMQTTGALLAPPGGALKWLFLAGHAGYWILSIGGGALTVLLSKPGGGQTPGSLAASLAGVVGVVCLFGAMSLGPVWLYRAWGSVPEQMRYTDSGRWLTPGQACGYTFIPFYNLYWMFVANLGLCEAINRTLVAQGRQPRAPKGLATAACIVQLVPYCNLLIGPILWVIYMFQVDGARREMMIQAG